MAAEQTNTINNYCTKYSGQFKCKSEKNCCRFIFSYKCETIIRNSRQAKYPTEKLLKWHMSFTYMA